MQCRNAFTQEVPWYTIHRFVLTYCAPFALLLLVAVVFCFSSVSAPFQRFTLLNIRIIPSVDIFRREPLIISLSNRHLKSNQIFNNAQGHVAHSTLNSQHVAYYCYKPTQRIVRMASTYIHIKQCFHIDV